jgi:hypothetical protein
VTQCQLCSICQKVFQYVTYAKTVNVFLNAFFKLLCCRQASAFSWSQVAVVSVLGSRFGPLCHWDRMFETHSSHGCLSSSFCIVLSCVGWGLATGRSPVVGSRQMWKSIHNFSLVPIGLFYFRLPHLLPYIYNIYIWSLLVPAHHLALKKETARFSETLASTNQSTRRLLWS